MIVSPYSEDLGVFRVIVRFKDSVEIVSQPNSGSIDNLAGVDCRKSL
jgi:hypothetical protein